MRIALICGSRSLESRGTDIFTHLEKYDDEFPIDLVIHGGAAGPDTISGIWADSLDKPVKVFRAKWQEHGRKAGIFRNIEMLDYLKLQTDPNDSPCVIAFWDGKSKGTKHTIDTARKRGIPTRVYRTDMLATQGDLAL